MRTRNDARVRFAVIGQGYFAQSAILPAFAQATGCELRAIFSQDETKLRALRRRYGVAAALGYDQFDDYLRSGEVDAVYVALPNDMHADITVRAARAGVHVLCEKPIATNSRDAAYDHSALAVVGETGRVRLDPAYENASGLTVEVDVAGRRSQRKTFPKRDQVAAELVAFARCVRDGREPEPSGEEGLADLHVLEAIQRATESGSTERVAPISRRARPTRAQSIRRKPHGVPPLVNVEAPAR